MGKKKDKLLKKAGSEDAQIPWHLVDNDPLGFLVAPEEPEKFFKQHWEKEPVVFRATPERLALFKGLCSFPAIINWLQQRQHKSGPLEFGVDVNAARYRDGVRETPNGEVADAETLQALHNSQGCTLQLHQPQRFFDSCWRLLAALERHMGCLVGSNSYLTPAGSQGLAPHHDDVEIWVAQTAGTKAWRVYAPRNNYKLPNQPSGDLDQGSLGEPVLEVELAVGDVLYLPRGAVHQAVASGSSNSSHLTISTYQRSSYADLATHLLQVGLAAQDEPECLPLAARCSPAPGTLLKHSLHQVLAPGNSGSTTPDAVTGLAEALRAIAVKLEATPDMMTAAVHSSALDFLMNRLPPHPKQLPARGRAPTLDDKVWCRVAGWCYLLPFEMTGMNCEDDEDEGLEEGSVKLVSCLTNSREEHMITLPDEEDSESDEDEEGEGEEGSEEEGSGEGASEEEGSEEAIPAEEADGHDKQQQEEAEQEGEADKHKHSSKGHKPTAGNKTAGSEAEMHCCGEDGCHHNSGVQEHSLSSGAAERENPVAALPGLVLAPGVVKAVVAFMAAEKADQAVEVRDLPLPSDGAKLQLAFALWAEGLAAVVPGSKEMGKEHKAAAGQLSKKKAAGLKKQKKRAACDAPVAAAAATAGGGDQEGTATSEPGTKHQHKKAKA